MFAAVSPPRPPPESCSYSEAFRLSRAGCSEIFIG